MLVIPKKDFPKMLNPVGLKRGDTVEIEIGDVSPDFITLDPTTLKLKAMRDPMEPREPLVKQPKPKAPAAPSMAHMPLPALKSMIQNPAPAPAPAPAARPLPPMPPAQ